jgi:hypothetical protein
VAADPTQEPAAYAPADAPPEEQAPPAEQAAPAETPSSPGRDAMLQDIERATCAGAQFALAAATGKPEQIDPGQYAEMMKGVLAGAQAHAVLDPPEKPLDPNAEGQQRLDASRALLQDKQHADEMDVQRETARRREGRPSGPAKP